MKLSINASRSELGHVLGRQSPKHGRGSIYIDISGQQANTLLHDGHAWKDFRRTAPAATRRAMRAAEAAGATLFVRASFAFVHAVEHGAGLDEPLRSCVETILECEALAMSAPLPACLVRLGYLYGPYSADLRAYRKAFERGRPYWSGPAEAPQYHLHQCDAASALLAVAKKKRNAGKIYYAIDTRAASFMHFMDAFAHRVGRPRPLHLPLFSRRIARVIVSEEHMQQTALAMPPRPPAPRVPGWKPKFADYRDGLDQIIAGWRTELSRPRHL